MFFGILLASNLSGFLGSICNSKCRLPKKKKAFTLHLPVNHLDQHLSGSVLLRQTLPADGVARWLVCNKIISPTCLSLFLIHDSSIFFRAFCQVIYNKKYDHIFRTYEEICTAQMEELLQHSPETQLIDTSYGHKHSSLLLIIAVSGNGILCF